MCGEIGYGTKNSNGLFEGIVAQIDGGREIYPNAEPRDISVIADKESEL